jgi:hypothetical protein
MLKRNSRKNLHAMNFGIAPQPSQMKRIIVAEGDPAIGEILQLILEGDGYQVEVAISR